MLDIVKLNQEVYPIIKQTAKSNERIALKFDDSNLPVRLTGVKVLESVLYTGVCDFITDGNPFLVTADNGKEITAYVYVEYNRSGLSIKCNNGVQMMLEGGIAAEDLATILYNLSADKVSDYLCITLLEAKKQKKYSQLDEIDGNFLKRYSQAAKSKLADLFTPVAGNKNKTKCCDCHQWAFCPTSCSCGPSCNAFKNKCNKKTS